MKCSLFHYSCSKMPLLFQSRKSHYSVIPEKPRPRRCAPPTPLVARYGRRFARMKLIMIIDYYD